MLAKFLPTCKSPAGSDRGHVGHDAGERRPYYRVIELALRLVDLRLRLQSPHPEIVTMNELNKITAEHLRRCAIARLRRTRS